MIFENTTFHLSYKYLFLNLNLSAELSEKQERSKIQVSVLKYVKDITKAQFHQHDSLSAVS